MKIIKPPERAAVLLLSDHVVSEVRLQCSRDTDAILRLVVLEQRSHDARQSQSRSVERVAERDFLVLCTAVTALEAVSLIGVEVTRRADLESTVLGFAIYLKVIAESCSEAHVAA